jgi:hypothetical protein
MKTSTSALVTSAFLALLLAGCGGAAGPGEGSDPTPPPVTLTGPVSGVHPVECGCVIEGIGHCGNYAVIEGQVVPLEYPALGKMEFCGREGLRASIEGEVVDGRLVAASFDLVE